MGRPRRYRDQCPGAPGVPRQSRPGRVPPSEASRVVRDFIPWPVIDNSFELLDAALDEQARWGISLWDSLILAAARASGASELITEDLNHGRDYAGVRAVNPFV